MKKKINGNTITLADLAESINDLTQITQKGFELMQNDLSSFKIETKEDLTFIHKDLSSIHTELSSIHTDITSIHRDLSSVNTDLSSVHTELHDIRGDLERIEDKVDGVRRQSKEDTHALYREIVKLKRPHHAF